MVITKAISGHEIVEGKLVAWKVLIKHLLDWNALGSCHHGTGPEPWGRGRRCWRRNEVFYWASQFGLGPGVLLMNLERSRPFASLTWVCFCQHSTALIHYQLSVTPLPYIETVRAKKTHLGGQWLRMFGNGINEHFTFPADRWRALKAKTALWFSSLAFSSY